MASASNEMASVSTNLPAMGSSIFSSQPPSSTPSAILAVPDAQLPSYITPFRETLDPGILSFLHWRGALSVPQGAFRESLLRAYICYVHPSLPLLDLGEFLSAIEDDGKSRTVSLTLFQAVMFAGSTFVDIDVLEREGFKSHEQARRMFYSKVRTLYDADLETDSLTLIQILVLMTYWYDKIEDPKRRSHWMRIALSFVTDLGLIHHSSLIALPAAQQQLRRRIWWCCLMRDQLISFSERQPPSTPWNESDFPVLLIDDLDVEGLSKALDRLQVLDCKRQSQILMQFCFQKIKLSILIARILHTQYEWTSHRSIASLRSKLFLLPKSSSSASAEYMSRDQELREWGDDTCTALHQSVDIDPSRNSTLVAVHSAVLEMVYSNVLGLVHRPQTLSVHPEDSAAKALQTFSHQTLRRAAMRISEIAEYLNSADLLRFLPPIGLTALLFAGLQLVKDSRSASLSSVHGTTNQNIEQIMQAMIRLKEMYPQAHYAVSVLELVRNKNLDLEGDESLAIASEQVNANNAQTEPEQIAAPEQLNSSEKPAVITGSSWGGIDYSRAKGVDFESLLNLDDVSDIFVSGGFGIADFEQVDWSEIFQERNWDA
ncbi:hypothetical protein LTR84_006366 [Exophiala bonariae]|uniref:Xylanolytic transcriptional activator regulatory domain-containing protein n=1 Tax=Exophiala bonariae TaxID=1690606 RepID=A0AAV9N126_9EURO|nr:hypothetical protein LTR84_006366 [Exophiala bonariae]